MNCLNVDNEIDVNLYKILLNVQTFFFNEF